MASVLRGTSTEDNIADTALDYDDDGDTLEASTGTPTPLAENVRSAPARQLSISLPHMEIQVRPASSFSFSSFSLSPFFSLLGLLIHFSSI